MSANKFDKLMKDALINNTEPVLELKDDLWAKIEQETIKQNENNDEVPKAQPITTPLTPGYKKHVSWIYGVGGVAAAVMLMLATINGAVESPLNPAQSSMVALKQSEAGVVGMMEETDMARTFDAAQEAGITSNGPTSFGISVNPNEYQMKAEEGKLEIVPNRFAGQVEPTAKMDIEEWGEKEPNAVASELTRRIHLANHKIVNQTVLNGIVITVRNDKRDSGEYQEYKYVIKPRESGGSYVATQWFQSSSMVEFGPKFDSILSTLR